MLLSIHVYIQKKKKHIYTKPKHLVYENWQHYSEITQQYSELLKKKETIQVSINWFKKWSLLYYWRGGTEALLRNNLYNVALNPKALWWPSEDYCFISLSTARFWHPAPGWFLVLNCPMSRHLNTRKLSKRAQGPILQVGSHPAWTIR